MGKHNFLFVMCPPYQGSTLIYRLLNTSENVSTFLQYDSLHMGEGWGWLNKIYGNELIKNRWNKKYNLPVNKMYEVYMNKWDTNKKILCDKSPCSLRHIDKIYDFFSKKGEVNFVFQIRHPFNTNYMRNVHNTQVKFNINNNHEYSNKGPMHIQFWDETASMIKESYLKYKNNSILIKYEDVCLRTEKTCKMIEDKFPNINKINFKKILNTNTTGKKGKLVYHNKEYQRKDKEQYFKKYPENLEFFYGEN